MSDTLYAVLLGIVQGITEFLPISSSGHLIIFSHLSKGHTISLTLNVALHLGTLISILIYFRKDWFQLCTSIFPTQAADEERQKHRSLLLAIIVGTIPAGVLGLLFKDDIERVLHHPKMTIAPLIIVGILLWLVDRKNHSQRNVSSLTWKQGLWIGIAQAMALIPGTSRSGATMLAGRWVGLSREESARFSFLLGTPAMGGAVLLDIKNILTSISDPVFYIGFAVSFITGYATIALLLSILRRIGFGVFALYRTLLGVTIYFIV